MADVNFIKSQLESWRKCIDWIDKIYPEKLFILEHELRNERAITYEEKLGGSSQDESMRRSIINDKITELETYKRHCESVIAFCERIIDKVKPQYQEVFRYRYETSSTISWISWQTGFEEDTIYKISNRETERIANE